MEERILKIDEEYEEKEEFIKSEGNLVKKIKVIDGKKIGEGKKGKIERRMREVYIEKERRKEI